MKKLVAVLLAGVMCVSLAACGGKKEEAADTTAAETTETTDKAATEDTEDAAAIDGTFTTVADGVLIHGNQRSIPAVRVQRGR